MALERRFIIEGDINALSAAMDEISTMSGVYGWKEEDIEAEQQGRYTVVLSTGDSGLGPERLTGLSQVFELAGLTVVDKGSIEDKSALGDE